MPPLAPSHRRETSSVTIEGVFAASQWDVSATDAATEIAGHAVLNVYGQRELRAGLELTSGVENVFDTTYRDHLAGVDTTYRDHLAGVNRAGGGDVSLERRLPALGRNLFMMLAYHW